ncbi:Putative F-box/LRR-repeat protein At3g18150 [Linum perenne]
MVSIQNRIVDRLSDLLDSILHHILSFVDTKSSVKTSILSRRWRSVWKYVDVLTFSQRSFLSNRYFKRCVRQVLSLRCDGSRVCKVRTDFRGEKSMHLLERIMKYAACYQSLKVLELNQISVKQNVVRLWSRLELLESLTLTRCRLNFDDAFASFPRLETLKLNHCFSSTQIRTSVLKVIVSKLLNLEIVLPEFSSLEIVAPKLQFLSLGIDHTIRLDVSKSNLPSLNRANIKLLGISSYSSEDFFKKQLLVEHLFQILRNVQTLNLQVENFELLVDICNLAKRQASPFERMKSLSLKHSVESFDVLPVKVISYFLGGSPDEEDKRFTVEHGSRHKEI